MRRSAFTLVELLAATALATLLMLVVLAVLSGLARDRRLLAGDERRSAAAAVDAAADLIRRDLAQAERLRVGPDRIELSGFGALDRDTFAPTQRPARVVYRIEGVQGRRWLLRDQTDLDVADNHDRWSERVCVGVSRLRVIVDPEEDRPEGGAGAAVPVSPAATPTTAPAEPAPPRARVFGAASGRRVPAEVELVLDSDAYDGPALDRVIRVR